ncbi:MAG TPA: nucleoside-triphosphatase [Terriglobia bacterium]|nr:nucleoside-triphosphatase [Terriglobia bacterium]
MSAVILVTGAPGVGKTSMIKQLVGLELAKFGGFYTEEVRQQGQRLGFEVVTIDGRRGLLAQKSEAAPTKSRVGKYAVNVDVMDQLAVPAMIAAGENGLIVVVDEIGPMEMFSASFRLAVKNIVDDQRVTLIGSIVERSCEFSDEVKQHPRAMLIRLTRENREYWARMIPLLLVRSANH